MKRNPANYVRFLVVHSEDGGDPVSEETDVWALAEWSYACKIANPGIISVSIFGYLETGEPHLLAEWDRDAPPRLASEARPKAAARRR